MKKTGFIEIDHTADWAYRVWGENLGDLIIQAAFGLYTLADVKTVDQPIIIRAIELQAIDNESLLVAWLNELIYYYESENLAFTQFQIISLAEHKLQIQAQGAQVQQWQKYIKAVTYNNISIQTTPTGLEVTLVLDV